MRKHAHTQYRDNAPLALGGVVFIIIMLDGNYTQIKICIKI